MLLRLRCQRGFTTVTLMGVLMVGALLVFAGFAAVDPDIRLSRSDQDSKQAYAAAEAGVQWYLSSLGKANDYYLKCDAGPDPSPGQAAPVNGDWATAPNDRTWRPLPGPGAEATYTVDLVPVQSAGFATCVEGNQYSMIDPAGNLRVRASGLSRGKTRTVLATLRRLSFIDFIYFTHFETLDPAAYNPSSNCAQFRAQRSGCIEIRFADTDDVLGPMHTNDNILVCGTPTLGRPGRSDAIELNGPQPVVPDTSCGAASPTWNGRLDHPAGQLDMPQSNTELKDIAAPDYRFDGSTTIDIQGDQMTVRNVLKYGSANPTRTIGLPANGVIYVSSTSCTSAYTVRQTYPNRPGCGDVWIKGHYDRDLTIGAQNDIIINGNLTRDSDGRLLGLIANNFVRVYHPVTSDCRNATGYLANPQIHAAILALSHSFIVDNWDCGSPGQLGSLTVDGAIAQYYRGPVSTVDGTTIESGYRKDYKYNDRLHYREPPYFLDPKQTRWRVARQTEVVPSIAGP